MEANLFKSNLSKEQVKNQTALKENIEFCSKLVQDLSETFDVHIIRSRQSETEHETMIFSPKQLGRYGYGFSFKATEKEVSFSDGRGLWLERMANILGVSITSRWDEKERKKVEAAAKRKGISLQYTPDSACGDKYGISCTLSPKDKKLNAKLKLIIATMMAQGVVTRI